MQRIVAARSYRETPRYLLPQLVSSCLRTIRRPTVLIPKNPIRASHRVPDRIAEGCFSTGAIVMTGPSEYIIDFLQTIGRAQRVAARVVIPHPVMPQFIEALQTNLGLYRDRFGDPSPTAPQDPNARRPSPQEIYDDLKLPDDVLSGAYANGVMIGHGATEFGLDFLTSFFPQSAVSESS